MFSGCILAATFTLNIVWINAQVTVTGGVPNDLVTSTSSERLLASCAQRNDNTLSFECSYGGKVEHSTNSTRNWWTQLTAIPSRSLDACRSWLTDEKIDYIIDGFWREHQDPVASHMPFISGGPWKIIGLVLFYLSCVYLWLPLYMRNRPAYACTRAMKIYNLTNVVLNAIGFLAAFLGTNFSLDVWGCKKKYFPTYLLYLGYGYLLLKFFDFFDTLFFLLRKKQSQVTFLHVTHHCLMPITCYIGLKFVPYGNTGFTPIINSFVHVVMYFYYYLASLGPSMQQILWWKKYITVMQLAQFALGIVHALQIYYIPNCQYPRWVANFELVEAVYFFVVFFKFYRKTYWGKKTHQLTEAVKKID